MHNVYVGHHDVHQAEDTKPVASGHLSYEPQCLSAEIFWPGDFGEYPLGLVP